MTKVVAYNEKMLDTIFLDLYKKLEEYGSIYIDYDKPYKEKTKKQVNFFFGAIVNSVIDFFKEQGTIYSVEEIKDNFYQAIAPRKIITQFNGKKYETWKHISEMSLEEMSEFIDKSIWLCDNAKIFQGLILHPSIRNVWIRHITQDDIYSVNKMKIPLRDKEYLEYIRKQPCLWCGIANKSEAHHLRINNNSGVAIKPSDVYCVPLCRKHHIEYHAKGSEKFYKECDWITKYVDIATFCMLNYSRWYNKR